ncbi:MAG: hypothetical protein WKF83_16985 [Nocardioidaceae bacterium]
MARPQRPARGAGPTEQIGHRSHAPATGCLHSRGHAAPDRPPLDRAGSLASARCPDEPDLRCSHRSHQGRRRGAATRGDPLAGVRDRFDLPEGLIYLDGNSLGALPRGVAQRVARVVEQEWGRGLIGSWNVSGWMDLPATAAAKIARLIGAAPDEVVVADSTSVNLFKLLVAAAACARVGGSSSPSPRRSPPTATSRPARPACSDSSCAECDPSTRSAPSTPTPRCWHSPT